MRAIQLRMRGSALCEGATTSMFAPVPHPATSSSIAGSSSSALRAQS